MSSKAAPHDIAERPVYGTPRTTPYVMLCHATLNFCGRHWIANTWEQYVKYAEERKIHEKLCGSAQQHGLVLPF